MGMSNLANILKDVIPNEYSIKIISAFPFYKKTGRIFVLTGQGNKRWLLKIRPAENINISFWFYIKDLSKGPLNVQIYNGTAYNTWYDLTSYPGAVKNTWIQFSQTITDMQYFISDFQIRFDGSAETTNSYIDDVLITINQ